MERSCRKGWSGVIGRMILTEKVIRNCSISPKPDYVRHVAILVVSFYSPSRSANRFSIVGGTGYYGRSYCFGKRVDVDGGCLNGKRILDGLTEELGHMKALQQSYCLGVFTGPDLDEKRI
ncbi:hypothetical protein CDAR_98871 [Caerostris darwini]|uniref:Uncharacterized protein n=1 Tax=Caerostris darwini TaxID=1538125 RepID=A0AAV4Q5E0_9ARAC|nr:hypothetical protein CDAR_98871 [Caerostris darwini]